MERIQNLEGASEFSLFVRKKNLVATIPSGNRTSDIDQQMISSSLGQGKESSLLQTFRNTSDEFSMSQSPQNSQSNETVSPPFGSRWRKRRRLSQNCFRMDINEQIYLLNTLWLFSFYEIIVSQFSCNKMKLDRKRKIEIIFWRQNFHFSRVLLSTLCNWSHHNFFSFSSIDLKFGMLTKI